MTWHVALILGISMLLQSLIRPNFISSLSEFDNDLAQGRLVVFFFYQFLALSDFSGKS